MVLFLTRGPDSAEAICTVAKNRHGKSGNDFKLTFIGRRFRFENAAPQYEPDYSLSERYGRNQREECE
jgi:hypothetical protein